MTPEEKRKYRWLKPLAYMVAYVYEYPVRFVLALTLLLPGLLLEKAGEKIQDLSFFIRKWIVSIPIFAIFERLGFYELHQKAIREERNKKTMQQD